MIFCPECGARLVMETAKFCYQCGTNLTMLAPSPLKNEVALAPDEENEADSAPDEETGEAVCDISMLETKGGSHTICYELENAFTKEEFVRAAWIALARNHAPEEIFKSNFGEITVVHHRIFLHYVEAELQYQAKVGADRKAPHIEYETYYEDVPYEAEEFFYNADTKTSEMRKVTKYKRMQKQRITMQPIVTDWADVCGNVMARSYAAVEHQPEVELDADLFVESFLGIEDATKKTTGENLLETDGMRAQANSQHQSDFYGYVYYSLNAPRREEIRYQMTNIADTREQFYSAQEYRASIAIGDESYEVHAFPFGKMPIGGAKIENEKSPEREAQRKTKQAQSANRENEKRLPKTIWERSMWFSIPTMLLLSLSIFLSCFLREPWVLILAFSLSIAAFVFSLFAFKKAEKIAKAEVQERIRLRMEQLHSDIDENAAKHRRRMLQLLNEKLSELSLAQVCDEDF